MPRNLLREINALNHFRIKETETCTRLIETYIYQKPDGRDAQLLIFVSYANGGSLANLIEERQLGEVEVSYIC